MEKQSKIEIIKTIIIIGFTLSVFFHYILNNYMGLSVYPYGTFLFDPADRFNDFFSMAKLGFNPYLIGAPSVYGPLTFILLGFLCVLPHNVAFVLVVVSFIIFFLIYIYKNLGIKNKLQGVTLAFVFSFMTYPFLFILDRGNLDMWVFVCLALFVYFYHRQKDFFAAIFLAFAIALKIYPIVFVVLFLIDKKYRGFFWCLLMTVGVVFFSVLFIQGGMVGFLSGIAGGFLGFHSRYVVSGYYALYHGIQHGLGFFGIIKIILSLGFFRAISHYLPSAVVMNSDPSFSHYRELIFTRFEAFVFLGASIFYSLLALGSTILLFFFINKKEKVFWKKIALLVFAILILPQVSYDYKLIFIFIPLVLFINSGEATKYDGIYSVLFGLLLIPKDYYIIIEDVSIAVVLNPLIMLVMAALIVRSTLKNSKIEDKKHALY